MAPAPAIAIEALTGERLQAALPDLGRLRMSVFRDFPYLYDGTAENEARYLERFARADRAVIVAAIDRRAGDRVVGVATAAPLAGEDPRFREPFETAGLDPSRVFYFAESVLDPAWRGHGVGHRFFDERERHARSFGDYDHAAFCAVVRPPDHPARPDDYSPLDIFWEKRGYRRVPGLIAHFGWKDIGDAAETDKPMQFWMRRL